MDNAWQRHPCSRAIASTVAESSPPETRTTADFTVGLAAQRGEPRARLAGGFRARVAGDDVLEGIARAAVIALLAVDRRDGEHRIRRLGRLRVFREQLLLRGERVAIVAQVGVADADPVHGVGRELALRIVLEEGLEGLHRAGEV